MSRLATDRSGFPATVVARYVPNTQPRVVGGALTVLVAGAFALALPYGWRHGALLLVGGGLGLVLYHAAFGFTAAFRGLVAVGDSRGLRAQMLMLALATVLFAPILADGRVLGTDVGGAVAPASVAVLIGAFVFAIGMQLAGGCGSGCLFHLGGGAVQMIFALAAFVAGSVLATFHASFWNALPSVGTVSLGERLGWTPAVMLQLSAFAAIAGGARLVERRRLGEARPVRPPVRGWARVVHGPWPLAAGAVALAGLNALVLVLAGHPWTITWAFTLVGAKALVAFGYDLSSVGFWSDGFPAQALATPLAADVTTVMDVGIVLGALLAAGLAGRFAPSRRLSGPRVVGAIVGGLLLGYGARIAFGCNIGAYVSGIASTSLHGWVWLAGALLGTPVGVTVRRLTEPRG